jgi:hypothetical protein
VRGRAPILAGYLSEAHRDALERALWVAIRNLANKKQIHELLAEKAEKGGDRPNLKK